MAAFEDKTETVNVDDIEGQESDPGETEDAAVNVLEGYTVEAGAENTQSLKLAIDGRTVLIPQPSDDPVDPLNWSKVKKHLFLFIISASAFLPDYGSAVGAVTLLPQAE